MSVHTSHVSFWLIAKKCGLIITKPNTLKQTTSFTRSLKICSVYQYEATA